jgi:hypothetical protein
LTGLAAISGSGRRHETESAQSKLNEFSCLSGKASPLTMWHQESMLAERRPEKNLEPTQQLSGLRFC